MLGPGGKHAPNLQVLAQRWSQDTESLLIFNPRDEAVRESYPFNPLSILTQSKEGSPDTKLLIEAIEHMQQETYYLREQLKES